MTYFHFYVTSLFLTLVMLFLETQITSETLVFTDRQFDSVWRNKSRKRVNILNPRPTYNKANKG